MTDIKNPEEIIDNQTEPEKKFTQEDVDRIVKNRLARNQASEAELKKRLSNLDKREAELEDKETALTERESEIKKQENISKCMAFLDEKGLPNKIADIINTDDPDAFITTVEKLTETFSITEKEAPPLASTECGGHGSNVIEQAFSKGYTHTPKGAWWSDDK